MRIRTLFTVRPHRSVRHRVRAVVLALCATAGTLFITAPSAQAYAPVDIVHTEQVQVGPYELTVGFSKWPLRATQSLDFTFAPEGGIGKKTGTLSMTPAGAQQSGPGEGGMGGMAQPLSRHPRKRSVWGLDVQSLSAAGKWNFTFAIDGSQGTATGTLKNITVLEQPGPPLPLSWSVCALPVVGLVVFLAVAWRRHRPAAQVAALLA
ncbi:hypothetical protein SUDANB145_06345 [Streptomyces sp. enrichment culture]|uniref:hypothetical protein n=1 Tax=Streptomyces sp. enrichment culture TaxID=1795815 RepID=UPI003F574DD7